MISKRKLAFEAYKREIDRIWREYERAMHKAWMEYLEEKEAES